MTIAFWLWTVLWVVSGGLCSWLLTEIWHYRGNDITRTIDVKHLIKIYADESVTIEAESGSFFALMGPSGKTIVGTPRRKPLDWDKDEYYWAKPTQTQGGTWIVETGKNIKIHLTSSGNMTIEKKLKSAAKVDIIAAIVILCIGIWAIGWFGIGWLVGTF